MSDYINKFVKCVHCGHETNIKRHLYTHDLTELIKCFYYCKKCDKNVDTDE